MRELILSDLEKKASNYQLKGVEFTQEDANYVESLIANGTSYEDAIDICLEGIYDVLNEDEDDTLLSKERMVEWAGELKELYNKANSDTELADCADAMADFIDDFLKVYNK